MRQWLQEHVRSGLVCDDLNNLVVCDQLTYDDFSHAGKMSGELMRTKQIHDSSDTGTEVVLHVTETAP